MAMGDDTYAHCYGQNEQHKLGKRLINNVKLKCFICSNDHMWPVYTEEPG